MLLKVPDPLIGTSTAVDWVGLMVSGAAGLSGSPVAPSTTRRQELAAAGLGDLLREDQGPGILLDLAVERAIGITRGERIADRHVNLEIGAARIGIFIDTGNIGAATRRQYRRSDDEEYIV